QFAQRVTDSVGYEPLPQLRFAFRLAYNRLPNTGEEQHLTKLIQSVGLEPLCRALFNSSEFLTIP
ncbi:MAG: hypothetical protein ABI557_18740, partial [Aureliella sp.]